MALSQAHHRLHIVHTEASQGWGGQELRILSESEGMIARGHRVTILTPPTAKIFSAARERGIPVQAMPFEKKRLRGVFAMRRWLAAHQVDVINTHSSTDSWLVALAQLGRRQQVPVVRTRHISAPVGCDVFTRWLYTRATDYIVTTGERLRQELIERNGFPAERITSVPTGMDPARFVPGDKAAARAALRLPKDAPLIGIVATIRSWKGHQYLVEALSQLKQAQALLVIVGDGPARERIVSQIHELHLDDRVLLPGNQDDVLPWLQALDAFALPSYANEGVPQALIQAMLCARPIVTTDVGSILDAVTPDQTALVVPARDSTALGHALYRLLSDRTLAQQLGQQARQVAERKFSRGTMLDSMERIFETVSRSEHGFEQ